MSNPEAQPPSRRIPVLQILLAMLAGLLVWFLLFHVQPQQIPYSLFLDLVEDASVRKVSISKNLITGRYDREAARPKVLEWRKRERQLVLTNDEWLEEQARETEWAAEQASGERDSFKPPFAGVTEQSYPFVVLRGEFADDEHLAKLLHEKPDIIVQLEPHSDFLAYLVPILFLALLLGMGTMFLMRRTDAFGQQVLTFGKSRAKVVAVPDTKTTFDDVAGCEEAKEELAEVVSFLRDPGRFERLGGTVPKGVILIGLPGTGKTLMARAVAGEARVPFFSLSGSDFVEMFVGVGAARVRDLFSQAKAKAPCIVFIDEIDAVGRQRGAGLQGGNDEREQTLNQLLSEMDGFQPNAGVIVLAATNRPDVLDRALLRPGRFDRQVVVDNADVRGREQILELHSRGKPIADDVELKDIARQTPGFSGADLANVMNEAALLAARRGSDAITGADLQEAVERVLAGPERRSRVIRPNEKEVIAYHETGHALVGYFCDRADRVHKISIVPRGHGALGYTLQLPVEDRYILQRAELVDRVCVLLGGRVAEEIVFGDTSTGAADDLEKVTDLARSMICRWGMSSELGPIIYQESEQPSPFGGEHRESRSSFSDATLDRIDSEVHGLIMDCYDRTRGILIENRDLLETLASELMEREVMHGREFAEIIIEMRGEQAPASTRGYPPPAKATLPEPMPVEDETAAEQKPPE